MSGHKRFTVATNVQVYFCDPRSPWQRGSKIDLVGRRRKVYRVQSACKYNDDEPQKYNFKLWRSKTGMHWQDLE
jgi:IS30 family transposase